MLRLYKGAVEAITNLLNCEALPVMQWSKCILQFLNCKNDGIRFNYVACTHIRKIIPIMLALCLMLLQTYYYAKNYAGIINSGLVS